MKINDKSVLVRLSISMPGNTRKDPDITKEVTVAHHLGDKSGRWLKQLYPKEALEPLTKVSTEARHWHYEHSLPWTDEGSRILPTAHHAEYTTQMREFRQKFETLSENHFLAKLPEWEAWARQQHNGTFNPEDYLPASKLREKFGFAIEVTPVPCGEDFRVDFTADELAELRTQVDTRVTNAAEAARKDLWGRLIKPVAAMVERLKQPDATFRDSLIGNLRDIVALIPALNLTSDADLEQFRSTIQRDLAHWDPDLLREDKATRAEIAQKAETLLAKMKGYAI